MAAGKKLFHVLIMSRQCNCHELISVSGSGAFSGCVWVSFLFSCPRVAASGDGAEYDVPESGEGEGLEAGRRNFGLARVVHGAGRFGWSHSSQLRPGTHAISHPSEPAGQLIVVEVTVV